MNETIEKGRRGGGEEGGVSGRQSELGWRRYKYRVVAYGMVWYRMGTWYMVCYGMVNGVWYGTGWFGLVWLDLVWSSPVRFCSGRSSFVSHGLLPP